MGNPAAGRLGIVDAARGLALCGMVAFHLDWDLAYLGWIDDGPGASLPWTVLGHAVAGTFLGLSGYGLVLARPRRLGAAFRRLAVLAGAALLVTGVTGLLFPEDAILFGILHCIAVSNVLALPLRRSPAWVLLVLAVLLAAVPMLLPGLDGPPWWWLGLGHSLPRTLDYRPLLPWSGLVLLGMAAAVGLPRPPPWLGASRCLARLGRHSLVVYLLHQPLLLGGLMLIAFVDPPPNAQAEAFGRSCRAECVASGGSATACAAGCRCLEARLGASTASPDAMRTDAMRSTAELCLLGEPPGRP